MVLFKNINIINKLFSQNSSRTSFGIVVFIFSFLLYVATLAPDIIWGDSANFANKVSNLQFSNLRLGNAQNHPLYFILGKIFSWLPGPVAWNLNLMSAFFASLTLFFVFHIILQLTKSIPAGIIGAAALCFSHTFWLHAVIAEVYTLNGFFVVLIIYIMLQWRYKPEKKWLFFVLISLIIGLTNHLVLILIGPALIYLLFVINPGIILRRKFLFGFFTISILIGVLILFFPHFFQEKFN